MDAAYKSLQETEHDPREKLANQVIHQYFRYIAGATSAIEELQRLAATPDQSSLAYFWMGTCYEQSDEFEKAACAFKESALASDTPVLRSQRLERAAICLFKSGNRESAFSTIVEEISDAGDREAMASLYNGLASLYKLADDPELRAIALEKALELSPNDVDLLFNAGYAHGEKGSSHLNLLHYKKLLEFRSDHAIGLNNVAIAYANLNMPIRAVTSYKAAVGELSTLAAANLANTFMDAGFKEEAESVLGKAREQGDLHPNVGSSMASLSKKDDDESQTEQQVAKMALEQQRFLRIFGESYFIPADRGDFSGEWHAEDGAATIVSETGDQIVGFRGDAPVKHFDGLVRNRAARITTYTPYKADRTGFAYLSVDGTTLLMMILNGTEEHLFLTLTREA